MEREFFGSDVDQALQKASRTMGLPQDTLSYRVLEGTFGKALKSRMVGILVEVEEHASAPQKDAPSGPSEEEMAIRAAGDVEWAVYLLDGILQRMNIQATTRHYLKGENVVLTVQFEDGDIDTRRGTCRELRGALQHLVNRAVTTGQEIKRRFIIDIGGTLEGRREKMMELAGELIDAVHNVGKPIHIHLMDSQDRRILHTDLVDDERIGSESSGNTQFRVLTLSSRGGDEGKGKKQG